MRDDSWSTVKRSIQTYAWSRASPGHGLSYVASSYFLS